MDFLTSGILSRADDALFALLILCLIQFCIAVIFIFIKKSFSPKPFAEAALRPLTVFLCDKLNRGGRSDFALIIRGSIVFFVVLAIISLVGIGLEQGLVYAGYGAYMDIILLALILSPLSVLFPTLSITSSVPRQGSFRHIAQSLNQNLIKSDQYSLNRAACKALALSFNEWIVAPIFYYLLGGMPFACLYVALGLFVRIDIGNKKSFISIYGLIYRFLQHVASLISFIFIFLASFFAPGGKPHKITGAFNDVGVNVEAYIAYVQNITLGGTIQNRHGDTKNKGWVGPEGTTAKIERADVIRVAIHYSIALFLLIVSLFGLYIYL